MKISSYSNRIGGFAAINTGCIRNCYSDAKVKHDRNAAGFVFENSGEIMCSVAQKRTYGKENIGCFFVQNKGTIEGCGWLCPEKKKKKEESFVDSEMIVTYKDLLEVAERLGLANVWKPLKKDDSRVELEFSNVAVETNGAEPILVDSADQLIEISKSIASGDEAAASAHYQLAKDISLGGRKWIPVGASEATPFKGIFDGNGHSIKNFKIKAEGFSAAGFFGYVKNAKIVNLSLDCILDAAGGVVSGAMCAENHKGTIVNCRVVAKVYADKICGGFVGKNSGLIEQCAFIGKVSKAIPIILFFLPLVLLLLAFLILGIMLLMRRMSEPPFVQESIDINQIPIVNTEEITPPPQGTERISIEMNQEAYFNVDTGVGLIDFVNPTRGTRDLVIHIMVSDAELLRVAGKTGRSAAEQSALESNAEYDATKQYYELYKSGLILIGNALPAAKLSTLADGTMLPEGSYEMLVVVDAYDPETNEKASLKAQLPITIHVVKSAE